MITSIILYFLQSAICMTFFYVLYWLFLKRDTFFRVNRIFLLLTLLASLLIPTLQIPFQPGKPVESEDAYHVLDAVVLASQEYLNTNLLEEVVVTAVAKKQIAWYQYVGLIYLVGIFVFSIRFLKNLIQLFIWKKKNKQMIREGVKVIVMENDYPPFSFLNFVFVNKEDYQKETFSSILAHEKVHIEQLHTIDLLVIEILSVFFWLNPVVWFYKTSIQEVHEYLADDRVVKQVNDPNEYKKHIVNQFAGGDLFRLANNFGQSVLKKRIFMLGKIKTPRIALVKLIFLIPVFIILVSAFAFTIEEEEKLASNSSLANLFANDLNAIYPFSSRMFQEKETEELQFAKNAKTNGIKNLEYKETANREEPFLITDQMPEYPGGNDVLKKYIAKNISYPEMAKKERIEGRVFVSFVVNRSGKVVNPSVVKGITASLNQEAIRVVSSLPKWKPGRKNGVPVNVVYTIPIHFVCKDFKTESLEALRPVYTKIKNSSDYHSENLLQMKAFKEREFFVVEKLPEFPGGVNALIKFIRNQVNYPVLAAEQAYTGVVYVRFLITEEGQVENARVLKGANVELNKEALRVINSMPRWTPGEQAGKKVAVNYTVPIRFVLN